MIILKVSLRLFRRVFRTFKFSDIFLIAQYVAMHKRAFLTSQLWENVVIATLLLRKQCSL
jgi:hypothetical protein